MEYIVIHDTDIFAVNRGKRDNESSNIIYRDFHGRYHTIEFETCAANYKAEHANALHNCIGERNINELYFVFYTSGIKTKIVFKKMHVRNLFRCYRLSGEKKDRFLELHKLIEETGYITCDFS